LADEIFPHGEPPASRRLGQGPSIISADAKVWQRATPPAKSRTRSQKCSLVFWRLADLAPSTKTLLSGVADFEAGNYAGRNMHFGIREHAMAAVVNGMSFAKVRPLRRDVFCFTDYMRAECA